MFVCFFLVEQKNEDDEGEREREREEKKKKKILCFWPGVSVYDSQCVTDGLQLFDSVLSEFCSDPFPSCLLPLFSPSPFFVNLFFRELPFFSRLSDV